MKKTMQIISLASILLLLAFNCINAQTVNFNIDRVEEVFGTSNTRLLIHPATNELIAYQGNIAFNSIDHGVNWNLKANFNFPDGLGVLKMSSFDPNIVYAGGGTLMRSTDGGNAYMELTPFSEGSGGICDIAIHPQNPATLYVGLENTLVKSEDYGLTWTDIPLNSTGLPTATKYRKLFIDTDSPSTVFVETESGGLYKTTDAGLNWLYSGPGYSVGNLKDFCWYPNGDILYQVENDRIYKSINGGDNWTHTYTINNEESISIIGTKSDNPNIVFFVSRNY